jgi:hypothetical protein
VARSRGRTNGRSKSARVIAVTASTLDEPSEGSLAWTGDSWLVAYVAAIFPYDQSSISMRRFAKR